MDKISCYNAFNTLFDQESEYLESLSVLLKKEREALAQDKTEIEKLSALKTQVIGKLEDTSNKRTALLQHAGYAMDKQGMETCIQWCDTRHTLLPKWKKLLDLTLQCRNNNQINGTIIEKSRHSIHQALSILYNQPISSVYGASGQAEDNGLSRTIAKA